MSKAQSVTVRILDKDYHIACGAGEEAPLQKAAGYVDEKLRESRGRGTVSGERLAVLCALNLAHELLQSQTSDVDLSSASRQLAQMQDSIDRVLAADLANSNA